MDEAEGGYEAGEATYFFRSDSNSASKVSGRLANS